MKKYFAPLLVSIGLLAAVVTPAPVGAINVFQNCGSNSTTGGATGTGGTAVSQTGSGSEICGATSSDSFTDIMRNIINTILFVLGIVAVIMIIIGGIRYVTSNGNSQQVNSAKDTVLYAVIGLIIAIMAYAIVNFVLARLK